MLVVVVLELPLEFLGPGNDSINALGPFGGDLYTGFGATQLGLRLDNGSVNGPVATFIDRGAIGGLSRVGDGATMETEGEIACDEGKTGEARLLLEYHIRSTEGAARLQDERATAPLGVHGGGWDEVLMPLEW